MSWRRERRPPSFCSGVVFLSFSTLPCFCLFYRSIPTVIEVYSKAFFTEFLFLFKGRFLNQIRKRRRTCNFQIDRTQTHSSLATRWWRTHFVLDMNSFRTIDGPFRTGDEHFSAGNEHVENDLSSFSHTYAPFTLAVVNRL